MIVSILFFSTVLTAQSLREIIKNYTIANNLDSISKYETIKIARRIKIDLLQGTVPRESDEGIFMKNPDKILIVVSKINGDNYSEAFDGENVDQGDEKDKNSIFRVPQIENLFANNLFQDKLFLVGNNFFQNELLRYSEEGKVLLEEDEIEKPVFKLTITINERNRKVLYIDKNSFFVIREVDYYLNKKGKILCIQYLTDFSKIQGLWLPMNQHLLLFSGIEVKTNFSNVEIDFDTPMDDSIFVLK